MTICFINRQSPWRKCWVDSKTKAIAWEKFRKLAKARGWTVTHWKEE